jgi:hypothetical protein
MPKEYKAIVKKIDSSRSVTPPDYMINGEFTHPYYLKGIRDNYLSLNELRKLRALIKDNAHFNIMHKFFSKLSRKDMGRLKVVSGNFQKLSSDPRVLVLKAIKKLKSMCKGFIFPREWPEIAKHIKTTNDLIKIIKPLSTNCKLHPRVNANLKTFYRQAVKELDRIKKTLAQSLPKRGSTISVWECKYTSAIVLPPELQGAGPRKIAREVTASEMKKLKPHVYNSLYDISIYLESIIKNKYQLTAKAYMKSFKWQYIYFRRHRCK